MKFVHRLVKSVAYRCGYSVKKLRVKRAASASASGSSLAAGELMGRLHKRDPYEDFDYRKHDFDPAGWGSRSPAFETLIEENIEGLELIIEVGTWKGGSAIEMARALDERDSDAKIICIDTWLGALEFWDDLDDAERYGALELKHGYPSVYYRFLANVCHSGASGRVIPFPQTSATAALWLAGRGVRAGLIYIDGSHEEDDVYADLCAYADLVAPGGIIFGDDWAWDGVRMAVQRFAREQKLSIRHIEDKWVLSAAQ